MLYDYRLPNGYIRFDKCMSLARLVSQILAYKDIVVSVAVTSFPPGLGTRLVSQVARMTCVDTCIPCMQLPFPRVRSALNYLMTIPVHTDDGEIANSWCSVTMAAADLKQQLIIK